MFMVLPWRLLWAVRHPGGIWLFSIFCEERCTLNRTELCELFGFSSPHLVRELTPRTQGASAVLIYGAIEAPLAQPQALLGGHFFGALSGIIITKLFLLLPTQAQFDNVSWLVVSLSCATAIVVMQLTKTLHPPAGATAILPALDPSIRALSWYFLPIILLSSSLALAVALLLNNIQRRYPVVWITPLVLPTMPNLAKLRTGVRKGSRDTLEDANGKEDSEDTI